MILRRSWVGKGDLKRQREIAEGLLKRLAKAGGLPEPSYENEPSGKRANKKRHFYLLRFQVPGFIRKNAEMKYFHGKVLGTGRDKLRMTARSLAAVEVVQRIEEGVNVRNATLEERLEEYEKKLRARRHKGISNQAEEDDNPRYVTWTDFPYDSFAPEQTSGSRRGLLEFSPQVLGNAKALTAAKALTLNAHGRLPELKVYSDQPDEGELKQWAEIRSFGSIVEEIGKPNDEECIGVDRRGAITLALEKAYDAMNEKLSLNVYDDNNSSFGIGKLFAKISEDQLNDLNELLSELPSSSQIEIPTSTPNEVTALEATKSDESPLEAAELEESPNDLENGEEIIDADSAEQQLEETTPTLDNSVSADGEARPKDLLQEEEKGEEFQTRLAAFRAHQKHSPLPIDAFEEYAQSESPVTIVRGLTGSGKTTRYPVMLSLLSSKGLSTRVVVAQPHSMTCQIAAHQAAFEQDYELGAENCPIGYSVPSDSLLATSESRTVVYQTPDLLLQRAANDPLFSNLTHLCIDEVHERNASNDLLMALAKRAIKERSNHSNLPPLQLVLIVDPADSKDWEKYFSDLSDDDNHNVSVLDLPWEKRPKTELMHIAEPDFPNHIVAVRRLGKQQGSDKELVGEYDDAICEAAAKVIVEILREGELGDGSILCFLPSEREIRIVARKIRGKVRKQREKGNIKEEPPEVFWLYSSNANYRPELFDPDQKIILSTDLGITSVAIPGVSIVLDSGRTVQSRPFESTLWETRNALQLSKVNTSRENATMRMRVASRDSGETAGTCYRLYKWHSMKDKFPKHTIPELLRVDLAQLALHMIAFYDGNLPLDLLLDTPDPPTADLLERTVRELVSQGHVEYDPNDKRILRLTPLGQLTSSMPTPPRLAKLLIMGISFRTVDSALEMAALLSVPPVLLCAPKDAPMKGRLHENIRIIKDHTSDVAQLMEAYKVFEEKHSHIKLTDVFNIEMQYVRLVHDHLEQILQTAFQRNGVKIHEKDWARWNWNRDRVAALVGLICGATPHVAHLVAGSEHFATREVPGHAIIAPHSVNANEEKRVSWYVYNELLTDTGEKREKADDKTPKLNVTTAVSPLEVALFAEDTSSVVPDGVITTTLAEDEDFLMLADQWAPVAVSDTKQREALLKLRQVLTVDIPQKVSVDPKGFMNDPVYQQLVTFVLEMLEQQRGERVAEVAAEVAIDSPVKERALVLVDDSPSSSASTDEAETVEQRAE